MGFSPSPLAKWFLALAVLQVCATSTIIIMRLVDVIKNWETAPEDSFEDVVFCAVLLLNAVFFLYHAFTGVLREVKEDLNAFMFAAGLRCSFEIIQFSVMWAENGEFGDMDTLVYVRFFTVVPLALLSFGLAIKVKANFGWHDFKVVGTDTYLLELFRDYSRFNAMLGIDLQMNLSLVIFAGTTFVVAPDGGPFSQIESIMYLLYGVVTLMWSILGHYAVRLEKTSLYYVFMALMPVAPCYILYASFVFFTDTMYDSYADLLYPLIFIGALAVVVRIVLFTFALHHKRNFGMGLKERVFERPKEETSWERTPLVVNL